MLDGSWSIGWYLELLGTCLTKWLQRRTVGCFLQYYLKSLCTILLMSSLETLHCLYVHSPQTFGQECEVHHLTFIGPHCPLQQTVAQSMTIPLSQEFSLTHLQLTSLYSGSLDINEFEIYVQCLSCFMSQRCTYEGCQRHAHRRLSFDKLTFPPCTAESCQYSQP